MAYINWSSVNSEKWLHQTSRAEWKSWILVISQSLSPSNLTNRYLQNLALRLACLVFVRFPHNKGYFSTSEHWLAASQRYQMKFSSFSIHSNNVFGLFLIEWLIDALILGFWFKICRRDQLCAWRAPSLMNSTLLIKQIVNLNNLHYLIVCNLFLGP